MVCTKAKWAYIAGQRLTLDQLFVYALAEAFHVCCMDQELAEPHTMPRKLSADDGR